MVVEEGRTKRSKKLVLPYGLPEPARKARTPLTKEQLEERMKKVRTDVVLSPDRSLHYWKITKSWYML